MDDETPKFSSRKEEDSEIYSSESSFYSLLLKSYLKRDELPSKYKPKKHMSLLTKISKKKKKFSRAKKKRKNNVSEPKGQFAKFLVKRFKLRNDYDEQHADEFLCSKEQAFEFPSRDDDIIIE